MKLPKSRRSRLCVAAASVALTLAACGGDGSTAQPASPVATEPAATVETTSVPTAADTTAGPLTSATDEGNGAPTTVLADPAAAPLATGLPPDYLPMAGIEFSDPREPGVVHQYQRFHVENGTGRLTISVVTGKSIETWLANDTGEVVADPIDATSAAKTQIYQVRLNPLPNQVELDWALGPDSFASLTATDVAADDLVEIAASIEVQPIKDPS